MSTKRWRSSSLEKRLTFQAMDCWEFGESASGGPNICRAGPYVRSTASWAICFCSGVPWESSKRISQPWR